MESGDDAFSTASLGSVEYIVSLCKSDVEVENLEKSLSKSSYGSDFIQAVLYVNKKVNYYILLLFSLSLLSFCVFFFSFYNIVYTK